MTRENTNLPAIIREIDHGPAMSQLTEKQRNFVYALIEQGGLSYAGAARAAGYSGGQNCMNVTGHRLAHDPKIQEALREMGPKILNAGLVVAAKFVLEVIDSPQFEAKDRLKAAEMVMNRTGMHQTTEHKVAVTHRSESSAEMIKSIELMASKYGLDAKKLIGDCVIEGVYEEVEKKIEQPLDDLSDLL